MNKLIHNEVGRCQPASLSKKTISHILLYVFCLNFLRTYDDDEDDDDDDDDDDDELMMNCFCGMIDRRKGFSLISSRDQCQRFYHSESLTRCEQDLNLRKT